MNVLVTGATGFLGHYIVDELIKNNIKTLILVRDENKIPNTWKDVKVIIGDINDDLTTQINNTRIDCIIHNAAKTPGADFNTANKKELKKEFFKINEQGTKNMIVLSEKLNITHFIFVSSHGVLEKYRKDFYVESKRQAEDHVKNSALNWTIIRPAGIYGYTNFWRTLITRFEESNFIRIYGSGNNTQQYIYAKDATIAIRQIIKLPICFGKTYVLSGKDKTSINEYHQIIKIALSTNFIVIKIPLIIPKIITMVLGVFNPHLKTKYNNIVTSTKSVKYNNQKAIEDFNYNPRSFEEGFNDLVFRIKGNNKI